MQPRDAALRKEYWPLLCCGVLRSLSQMTSQSAPQGPLARELGDSRGGLWGTLGCTHPAVLEDVVDPVGESLLLHLHVLCLQLSNVAHLVCRVHGETGLGEPCQGSVAGLLLPVSCSPKELLGIVGMTSHQAWSPLAPVDVSLSWRCWGHGGWVRSVGMMTPWHRCASARVRGPSLPDCSHIWWGIAAWSLAR